MKLNLKNLNCIRLARKMSGGRTLGYIIKVRIAAEADAVIFVAYLDQELGKW